LRGSSPTDCNPDPWFASPRTPKFGLWMRMGLMLRIGEIGELLIRGENVFVGYWNDPAATADSLRDGWYHTGDLMRRGEGDEL
jgi:long-chain acyl-CoA synthetase